MELTIQGLQLILDGEVGGGKAYYDRFCAHPVVPGGKDTSAGITIGIGYDIGQQSSTNRFIWDWKAFLAFEDLAKLVTAVGLRGDDARRHLPHVISIEIPWGKALDQFLAVSVPRYWLMTRSAFPGIMGAPQCLREGVLSLVYNRGTSWSGDRRREMRTIRDLIEEARWAEIPDQIRKMKRLWPETKGLRTRRDAEARHIEKGLEQA